MTGARRRLAVALVLGGAGACGHAGAGAPSSPPDVVPTSAVSPPSTHLPAAGAAAACVADLPLRFRAAQTVMVAVDGAALAAAAEVVGEHDLGGALLMTWPAGADPAALAALDDAGAVPVLLAVDEEGGDVQRLSSLGELPAAATVAATMTPAEAEAMIADHAAAVAALGVDVVFAPVVDVAPADGSEGPIGDRSFGADPAVVSAFGASYVAGWQRAGILPVLKHFPGHGSASADTHDGRATTPPLTQLRRRDLVPFGELVGGDVGVMVGHLDVPGLTDSDGLPASLSPAAITGLLRDELGAGDALVFTDALDMQAVAGSYGIGEAAVRALVAGADVAIVVADAAAAVDSITAATTDGRLTQERLDEAVGRILARKGLDACRVTPG